MLNLIKLSAAIDIIYLSMHVILSDEERWELMYILYFVKDDIS